MGVAIVVLSVCTGVFVVGSVVSLVRHPPPSLDRGSSRQVARTLWRGRLAAEEPARTATVRLAQNWSRSWWSGLMLLSLGAAQALIGVGTDGSTRVVTAVAAVLCLAGTVGAGAQVVQGRRALRDLDRVG